MSELEGLIHYWKVQLNASRILLSPETIYFVEQTIKYLEEILIIRRS